MPCLGGAVTAFGHRVCQRDVCISTLGATGSLYFKATEKPFHVTPRVAPRQAGRKHQYPDQLRVPIVAGKSWTQSIIYEKPGDPHGFCVNSTSPMT